MCIVSQSDKTDRTWAPCGLRGCKNGPAPFHGGMSYKVTKPGLVFRSTSKSRPNNIRGGKMYVRPSVRPQKVSSISMKFGI